MRDIEASNLLIMNHVLQFHVFVLLHFVAAGTNKMVVIFIIIRAFVERKVLAELVLKYEVALYQQLHGVVQGSATYAEIAFRHGIVQRFHIKMTVIGIDQVENSIAFGRFTVIIGR